MNSAKSIIKIDSRFPGKTLAVFCGVHGNEKAGVFAVKKALKKLKIKKGIVYFVFANPKAIQRNVRCVEKNLNRCFLKGQKGKKYEERRAVKLMRILNKTDALLDIHSSNNPKTTPFIIAETGFDIVKNMNFKIIATGFDALEPGATDGYMQKRGKIGICIECGYLGQSKKQSGLAYDSLVKFLAYFKAIDAAETKITRKEKQKIIHVDEVQIVTNKTFRMMRTFKDFEVIPKNTLIAKDDSGKYVTKKERIILFGTKGKSVGAEAYILGTWKR